MAERNFHHVFTAVSLMAYDPGDYDPVADVLDDLNADRGLTILVWMASDLVRRLAVSSNTSVAAVLHAMAREYLDGE